MATKADAVTNPDDLDTANLMHEIVSHAEKLLRQQASLLWSEARREMRRTGKTALLFGAGTGLLAAGGLLMPSMLAHFLHQRTRLPLWSCYGLLGAALGTVGAGLLARGVVQARQLQLPTLPQTAESLRENLTWLKDQTTSLRP